MSESLPYAWVTFWDKGKDKPGCQPNVFSDYLDHGKVIILLVTYFDFV